jgi:ATP/maltotriose-dependent transcriptional regulator MalT/DNA-binding SARP family transcriptional activator
MAGPKRKQKSVVTPAKTSAPHLIESYRRARLFRVLDAARRKRLIFVAAPAGAGKTSLVASYLAARRLPLLWYNVDARDADVANLFEFLATAARASNRRRKLDLPAFRAENQPGAGAFARTFFEALCQKRPVPSAIVFDDYQEAQSESWDEVIREGLRTLPRGISAFIISRAEPPPFLARDVAAGEMTVLGWDDLRLTTPEIVGLVRVHRPDLRGAHFKAVLPRILELANGWAAALTLLLHDRAVPDRDVQGIEEFSQRLFDYFATEIFSKATANQRDFLLRTSVVPSLTAELAARLADSADAGLRLADLERRSFLIQRLGTSGTYRYHPLLRDFLRGTAETELGAEEIQELHRQAAELLLDAGQIDEAMEQLEKANDTSARTELVLRVAPAYVESGRSHTIATWLERLPRGVVDADGWLLYWDALCCIGHAPLRSLAQLEKAHACFALQRNVEGLYRSCAAAMRAIVQEGNAFQRLDRWAERIESMQATDPACPEHLLGLAATGMLAASAFRPIAPARKRYWVERVLVLAVNSGDMSYRFMTGGTLAMFFVFHDEPARAAVIFDMLRVAAQGAKTSALATLSQLEVSGLWTWICGDNTATLSLVREALALAARTGVFVWNDHLSHLGATASLAAEDVDGAQEFLALLANSAQRGGAFAAGGYQFYASWDAMLRGDTTRALHFIQLAIDTAEGLDYIFAKSLNGLAKAQIEWQLGNRGETTANLALAREHAQRADSALVLHACDLVESDFAWDEDREHALECLRRGLALARARGYFNGFWLRRATMSKVAVRALEHGIETEHVLAYVRKHRLMPDHVPARVETWPWRLRLRALGSFELKQDHSDLTAPSAKVELRRTTLRGMPLRLLQTILAFGARGVRDTALIDALWPDSEGDAGRRVFDTTLHRLRRQLGSEEVLFLSDGRIFLDRRSCWFDVWALEDVVAEVEREVQARAASPMLEELARLLVSVYRGPLLSDEPGADAWARAPRERLAAKFLRAAGLLGQALEQGARFAEASMLYERVLERHPLAEPICAGLMRCAEATGNPAAASRIFEAYRARLAANPGTEPGPELRNAYARLARPPLRDRAPSS